MNSDFKQPKAISFKTATIIVLALHGVGFLALSQWSSYRASIAKERWNQKKEQLLAETNQNKQNNWPQAEQQKVTTQPQPIPSTQVVQATPTPPPKRQQPTRIVESAPTPNPTPLTETAREFLATKTKQATETAKRALETIPKKQSSTTVQAPKPKPTPRPQIVRSQQIIKNYDDSTTEEVIIERRVVRSYTVPIVSSSQNYSREITIVPVY